MMGGHTYTTGSGYTIQDDLSGITFNYDRETQNLYNPSTYMTFAKTESSGNVISITQIEGGDGYSNGYRDRWPDSFYMNPIILCEDNLKPFPNLPFVSFTDKNTYDFIFLHKDIYGNELPDDDYFVDIYIDKLSITKKASFSYISPSDDIWNNFGVYPEYPDYNKVCHIETNIPSSTQNVYARMRSAALSDVTTIESEVIEDYHIYDMQGRIVYQNNLEPGIYIRNAKKFIVH